MLAQIGAYPPHLIVEDRINGSKEVADPASIPKGLRSQPFLA
jgi:hypothetical protein